MALLSQSEGRAAAAQRLTQGLARLGAPDLPPVPEDEVEVEMQAARQERRARQDALSVPALALCSRRQSARLGPGRRRAAAPAGRWRQGRGVGALHERGAAGRVGRCAVAQQVRRKARPGRAVVVSHEVPCETLVVAAAGHRLQPLVGVVHFHPPGDDLLRVSPTSRVRCTSLDADNSAGAPRCSVLVVSSQPLLSKMASRRCTNS